MGARLCVLANGETEMPTIEGYCPAGVFQVRHKSTGKPSCFIDVGFDNRETEVDLFVQVHQ